jgi:hypothetical protein
MEQVLKELIQTIEEHHQTGAIGYSLYVELISKAREMQGNIN